jgi:hypothetical protein
MHVTGKGTSRKLYVVTLGGAGFTWEQQCSGAAYAAIPKLESAPFCDSQSGSRSPYRSTLLGVYDYKGSAGSVEGSGAATTAVAGAVGAAAVLLPFLLA